MFKKWACHLKPTRTFIDGVIQWTKMACDFINS